MQNSVESSPLDVTLAGHGVPWWRMLLVSVAGLYLELFLIRWLGTEVRVFAYVQNLVLVSCFLGFGLGCLRSAKPASSLTSLKCLTWLIVIVSVPMVAQRSGGEGTTTVVVGFMSTLSNFLTLTPDSALWGFQSIEYSVPMFVLFAACAVVTVALLLGLVTYTMIPLGQWVGYCFDKTPNTIMAYTINLIGSLIGTWLLLVLAWQSLSPLYWAGLAFFLTLLAIPTSKKNWMMGGGLLVVSLLALSLNAGEKNGIFWSPYQKLQVDKKNNDEYQIRVNNIGYMTLASTAPDFLAAHPDYAASLSSSIYDSPFKFIPPGANVLIVGAGAGNDASAALRNGAAHVDAVEIDPLIYAFGKQLHPDHPYDSDKVHVVINDARNYLRYTSARYDVIIFGLLDSHTGNSGYSNMRIDNYVYTKDSFEQARRLLKPNGVLVLKFEVRAPWLWIGQRFYRTLTEVFGREPVLFGAKSTGNMWGGMVFLESTGEDLWRLADQPDMKKYIADNAGTFTPNLAESPAPATDDWPYPYNRSHSIPETYLTVSAILLLMAIVLTKPFLAVRERQTWPTFLLGAGFMLMETQLITRLGLYFGTTWVVNSIAITTILCMLVLANLFITWQKNNVNRFPYYVILVCSLIANYVFPWESLPLSSHLVGFFLIGAYAISVFAAGVIFTSTLNEVDKKSKALGSNVIGAVAGGILQNASFIIGIKALIPMSAICYIGASLLDKMRQK